MHHILQHIIHYRIPQLNSSVLRSHKAGLQYVLIGLLILFSSSCQPKQAIKIMPDYMDKKYPKTELAYVVLDNDVAIYNTGAFHKTFGEGDAEDLFTDYFKSVFPQKLRGYGKFRFLQVINSLEDVKLKYTPFGIADSLEVYVSVPETGTVCTVEARQPGVILFIEKIVMRHIAGGEVSRDNTTGIIYPMSFNAPNLILTADFALWDNQSGQVVSVGQAVASRAFSNYPAKQTWNDVLTNLARIVLDNTPYSSR